MALSPFTLSVFAGGKPSTKKIVSLLHALSGVKKKNKCYKWPPRGWAPVPKHITFFLKPTHARSAQECVFSPNYSQQISKENTGKQKTHTKQTQKGNKESQIVQTIGLFFFFFFFFGWSLGPTAQRGTRGWMPKVGLSVAQKKFCFASKPIIGSLASDPQPQNHPILGGPSGLKTSLTWQIKKSMTNNTTQQPAGWGNGFSNHSRNRWTGLEFLCN